MQLDKLWQKWVEKCKQKPGFWDSVKQNARLLLSFAKFSYFEYIFLFLVLIAYKFVQ